MSFLGPFFDVFSANIQVFVYGDIFSTKSELLRTLWRCSGPTKRGLADFDLKRPRRSEIFLAEGQGWLQEQARPGWLGERGQAGVWRPALTADGVEMRLTPLKQTVWKLEVWTDQAQTSSWLVSLWEWSSLWLLTEGLEQVKVKNKQELKMKRCQKEPHLD